MKKLLFLICILILISGCNNNPSIDKKTASCIAENSVVYISTGCSACAKQKNLFGDYYNDLNKIDCAITPEKCREAEITAVPTWIINNEKILGVQSIEELKQLTGC